MGFLLPNAVMAGAIFMSPAIARRASLERQPSPPRVEEAAEEVPAEETVEVLETETDEQKDEE